MITYNSLKLYVWANPYHVPYGSSLVFAVADSIEKARELAENSSNKWSYGDCPSDSEVPKNIELGDPTRVLEIPCAEWHYWAE